ncbi:hypothetical protein [uncultured Methanomethylovorans sp.]|uniref:hypothetical protein n=1 Tax=uncultured Methanomethylovorans sp. TaxID=183759 RepID=UPI00374A62B1
MNSNHSLGKICIYKASKSENENEARKQLEKAIGYFEIAYSISSVLNPANFCYPFYYSFNEVLFKKVSSKEKIKNYINAAKKECVYSRKKHKLIEAIEQLAEALEIAHDAYESGGDWQETLKYCSDICNYAEQLMNENKDKTPTIFALYEKTKPSFEETIKKLIDNIRKKIEIGREKAVGTPYESIYDDAEKEAKRWLTDTDDEILSIIEMIPPDKIIFINNELNKTIEEIDPKRRLIIVLKIMREISLYVNDPMKVEVSQDVINDLLLRVARLETNTNQIREATNETTTRFEKNINDEIKELNKKVDIVVKGNICIENKVDNGFENLNQKADLLIFIELKKIASKLKEEGNEKGSQEVNNIADKIKVLLENNDPKEIIIFIEKLREKVPTLLEEIDKSNAPKDVKENAKKGLKENIMKFGRDISTGVAINWIATYLPSIIGAGASGFLALGIIFGALLSKDNLRDQGKK